jgi:hypothetical protein
MLNSAPISHEKRSITGASWGQERRLEFIEFRLLWEGKINRGELVDFFGTSIQQASLDLARYMEIAPGNLDYDRSEKVYKARVPLKPVLTKADAQTYLNELSGAQIGAAAPPLSFIGWRPPCDIVRYPARSIRPDILMRVIWAIRDHHDIEVSYQSMRRPISTRRWISPHAIGFDGSRWHARAWCHENLYFKDFVFARIQRIYGVRESTVDSQLDLRWHSYVTVSLRARDDLAPGQRAAIETEFGMKDGMLHLPMREALVAYFVRQLRFDQNLETQPLEWVNKRELESLLVEANSR